VGSEFLCVVLSCVAIGLEMGRSTVQGILPKYLTGFTVSEPEGLVRDIYN